ncbi:MAG: DUF1947 domain-containing protein [Methanosarcinales archaeon]|nr:DUF1947 domain-containing protein [Methanosarcinales archaeon]
MKVKSRHFLKKDEASKVKNNMLSIFKGCDDIFGKKTKLEIVKTDMGYDLIYIDGHPMLFLIGDETFLTVRGALKAKPEERLVVVDAGAIRFVTNGADVMCPGIVDADENIKIDDFVIIVEETHKKPLAIGKALISGQEMVGKSGKAVKSIHVVGDEIWKAGEL